MIAYQDTDNNQDTSMDIGNVNEKSISYKINKEPLSNVPGFQAFSWRSKML